MVRDARFSGASVFKTTNNGKEVWKASKSLGFVDGKRRFVNGFGATPEQAYARLQLNIERRLRSPLPARKIRRKTILLSTFCDKWLEHVEAGNVVPATVLKYRKDMDSHVLPHIGSMGLTEITTQTIDELFTVTLSGLGTSAKYHTFKELKQLFGYAVKEQIVMMNPCDNAKHPKHKTKVKEKQNKYIDRYVNMSKGLRKWLEEDECPFHDDYARYMMMLLGLRRAELLGLTWDCVTGLERKGKGKLIIKQELKRHEVNEPVSGWYIADRTKNGESRTIMLPEDWRKALLQERRKNRQGLKGTQWENLIFMRDDGHNHTYNDQLRWWKALLTAYWHKDPKRTGDLPDDYYWRPHDNRHILASIMAANEVPLSTAQTILGHLDSATTIYYTHVTQKSQQEAMSRIAEQL